MSEEKIITDKEQPDTKSTTNIRLSKRKVRVGVVVSNKMQKSITEAIE